MPWPKHNRLVVRGTIGTTKEEWSYSLKFNSEIPTASDVLPQDWDQSAVTAALVAFHHTANFQAGFAVTGWRGYQIGSDGNLIGDNMVRVDDITGGGGTGSRLYPPQVCLVLSLWADNRGPAQHGRIYLPGPNAAIDQNTATATTTAVQLVLADFKTMVEALKDAMYDPLIVGESLVNVSPAGTGVLQKVTEYRCGVVLDTMRSRRNKLVENYQLLSA